MRKLFMLTPFHVVKNYELKKLLWQSGGGTAPSEKYLKYKNTIPTELDFPQNGVKLVDPIWVFWNSGIDSAPKIVRTCYESLLRYSDRKVVLLTDKNETEYISMPEYLKKKSGTLPLAIYTDLMRMALLEHYGGTWVDSTVLLTESIPQEIMDSEFFVFHNSMGSLDNPVLYPVWFIHAKKHNQTIEEIRNILFAYWQRENHISEYLFSNIIITQVMKNSPEVDKQMPYLNSDYSEYLIRILGDEFKEDTFEWIKKLTGIHKLTYKLDPSIDKEGTVYHHLIGHT